MVFAAGSQNGVDKIREALRKVVVICPTAQREMEHDILVTRLTENAIFFDVRVWTCSGTYWDTYYYIQEGVSRQFLRDGVEAPKPAELGVAIRK